MELSEEERNVLVGFGVSICASLTTAAILAAVSRPAEGAPLKHSISIQATKGGTTSPTPGTQFFEEETNLDVEAVTFEGYFFAGWYLNGELAGVESVITVLVKQQNVLIASFEEIGAPPLIPAMIKPIQNCVSEEWWCTYKEPIYKWPYITPFQDLLHIRRIAFNYGFVKFKICDSAGNGVPGQEIALYTDPMPDITEHGILGLNNAVRTLSNPLILTTDGDGVVTARAMYIWWELASDLRDTIGRAARIFYTSWWKSGSFTPIYNGLLSPGYTSFNRIERLLHPIYRTVNPVHAYWVANPNLAVWGDTYVDCMIKLEESKDYPVPPPGEEPPPPPPEPPPWI